MTDKTVTMTTPAGDQSFPILPGSVGPDVVDIRKLYASTGMFTYDPGFTSTTSCQSAITYIDGEKGILLHRGYPIDQLAEHSTFMEVAYLLLHGELPTADELDQFTYTISRHTMLHEQLATFYRGFRRDAHPMAIMCGVVGALSAFYHDSTDITDPQQRMVASHRLIAKMPTIAAMAFKYSIGQPFLYPDNSLSYTGNFLRMLFQKADGSYRIDPVFEKALDVLFVLHADHEQNCSANAMRSVGSSKADPYLAASAAVGALAGPLHGGANEAVLKMLEQIGSKERVAEHIRRVKGGEVRLMGFGHRVYKNYDPRAKIIKRMADEVLAVTGSTPLLDVAMELEKIALQDDYFVQRRLYPNVDFYSGLIYQAMGFPTWMFPLLFAVARMSGWVSQWEELMQDTEQRIARPRQIYDGSQKRDLA